MIELLRELIKLAPARWVASLAGALALGVMVWYLGPLLAIGNYRPFVGTGARLVAVAAILVVWAGANFVRHLRQTRSEKKMIAGLAGAEQPGTADIAALRQRLEEALRHLRRVEGTLRRAVPVRAALVFADRPSRSRKDRCADQLWSQIPAR